LEAWLKEHADEVETLENGKIRCKLTGHDIPKRLDALQAHWKGRVYRRAIENRKKSVDLTPYQPHIVPHKRDHRLVYCRLTMKVLHNDMEEIEKHVQGRRFLFLMSEYNKQKPQRHDEVDDSVGRMEALVDITDDEEEEEIRVPQVEGDELYIGGGVPTTLKPAESDNDDVEYNEDAKDGQDGVGEEEVKQAALTPSNPAQPTNKRRAETDGALSELQAKRPKVGDMLNTGKARNRKSRKKRAKTKS